MSEDPVMYGRQGMIPELAESVRAEMVTIGPFPELSPEEVAAFKQHMNQMKLNDEEVQRVCMPPSEFMMTIKKQADRMLAGYEPCQPAGRKVAKKPCMDMDLVYQFEYEYRAAVRKHPVFAVYTYIGIPAKDILLAHSCDVLGKAHKRSIKEDPGRACAWSVVMSEVNEAFAAALDPEDSIEHARQEICHAMVTLARMWEALPELRAARDGAAVPASTPAGELDTEGGAE